MCLNIVLANEGGMTVGDAFHQPTAGGGHIGKMAAPPLFCSAAVKLAALQMQALGVSAVILALSAQHRFPLGSVFPGAHVRRDVCLPHARENSQHAAQPHSSFVHSHGVRAQRFVTNS